MADPKIPTEEHGLVQKAWLPYAEALKIAAAQADLLYIPDVNHDDQRPFTQFAQDDALRIYAESGRTHIFLEMWPDFQEHADGLTDGKINIDQFVERMQKGNADHSRLSAPEGLKLLGNMIEKSCALGMHTHFADAKNGLVESAVAELSHRLQGVAGENLEQKTIAIGNWLAGQASPLREQATACLLKKTLPEAKEFWAKIEGGTDGDLEKLKAEFTKAVSDLTTPEAFKERIKAANLARLSDETLAVTIAKQLNGEKGVLFYGAGHGNGSSDINEKLAAMGVSSVRMDVYPDRKTFQALTRALEKENGITGDNRGVDKPDLVYIVNEGVLYTTTETSPELIKAIQEKAKLKPVEPGDTDRGFDPEAVQKILDDIVAPKPPPVTTAPQP